MMSRRGGKRRPVLQLGDSSSKLHRYGYAKGFQSKESSGQGLPLTLVGDYSDSDSEDKGDDTANQDYDGEEAQDENEIPPAEQETIITDVNGGGGDAQSTMDDALRNFLSEIEAIPMPDEAKTPESISNGASPTPPEIPEEPQETVSETATTEPPVSKKKTGAYSMFVKGEMEFAHSPAPSDPDVTQEETKEKSVTDVDDLDIPEEPTTKWQMVQDEATQYYYYWNWQTNEVTWEIPSNYTQYLLLQKEYEVKMAKFTPEQLQAIKDKKGSNTKQVKASANGLSTAVKRDNEDLTKLDPTIDAHVGKDLEERSRSYHHKKKKSKKHKRRHDDSDEDLDGQMVDKKIPKLPELGVIESATAVKKMIGPQALSIVPYLSDNDEDGDEEEYDAKPGLEPTLSVNKENSSRSSPAPDLADSLVELHKSGDKLDTDSLVQDLVEFADSVTRPGSNAIISSQRLYNEDTEVGVLNEQEIDDKTGSDSAQIKAELNGFGRLEKVSEKELVIEENTLEEKLLDTEEQSSRTAVTLTDSKKDSCIEEIPVKRETKVKKEIINMFEDDSPPLKDATCDNVAEVENDDTELPADKMEIEEGEISDSLDSLIRPPTSVELNDSDSQKGKKALFVPSIKEKGEKLSKEPVSLFKGIVGYSEDDEEEEGELKEESFKAKIREELKLLESKRRDRKRDDRDRKKSDKHSKESKSRENHEKVQNSSSSSSRGAIPVHSLNSKDRELHDKNRRDKEVQDKNSRDKEVQDKTSRDKEVQAKNSRDKEVQDKNSRDKEVQDKNSRDKEVQDKNSRDKEVQAKNSRDKEVQAKNSRDKEVQAKNSRDKQVQDKTSRGKEVSDKDSRDKEVSDKNSRDKEVPDKNSRGKEVHDKNSRNKEVPDKKSRGKEVPDKNSRDNEVHDKSSRDKEVQDKSTIIAAIPVEEKPLEEKESVIDDTEDLDFDDLDDIDRVLEMALEKKRDQKTDKKHEVEKIVKDTAEILPVSTAENKTTEETEKPENVTASQDEPLVSDTDKERLTNTVKESAELALNKLRFLDISTKNLSKLQVLLIELQTRLNDWQGGGLTTSYFHEQLLLSEALLSQYEESAVPSGWLCQWDRASSRYFYQNRLTNHSQWEYPEDGGESKGKAEDKEAVQKKRRSKEEEREEVKTRGSSSSRSSRHRSKKTQDKDRSKRDRHSSNAHHHRKKKRRRRDHSSSSSSSEDESSQSRHRHRSKRKKRSKSDKSPSLEVIGELDGAQNAQVIEDSPPPSSHHLAGSEASALGVESEGTSHKDPSHCPPSPPSLLVADYGSEQDVDKEEEEGGVEDEKMKEQANPDVSADVAEAEGGEDNNIGEEQSLDGEEMEKEGGAEEEEEVNTAVIIRAPQIIVPPSYVAAMNQPQMYTAAPAFPSASISSSATLAAPPAVQDKEGETTQTSEDVDKGSKKKKKDKGGKEKSLSANSSIMMKKKRVSSMVQKWQQVKKEVEKEDRAKELRQAAIREKINQLK